MSTKIRITPIAITQVAVDLLLKDSYDLTGHNFAHVCDEHKLKNYQKYLMILTELQNGKKVLSPTDIDKNAFLKHLFFSFLIFAPSSMILKICESSNLSVTTRKVDKGRLALFSGTLEQWKLFLKNKDDTISRKLVSLFYQLGLGKCLV